MEAQRPAPPAVPIRIFFLGIPTRVMLLGGIAFADQPHRRSGKIRGHGEMLEISILPKCFTHLDSGLSGLWTLYKVQSRNWTPGAVCGSGFAAALRCGARGMHGAPAIRCDP